MKRIRYLSALAFAAMAGAHAPSSHAADIVPASAAAAPPATLTQWEFAVSGYAWASGLKGTLATLPPAPPVEVDVGFDQIIKNLGGALMGTFEAKYGRFVVFNDFIYTNIKLNAGRTAAGARVDAELDSKGLIGLAAAGYRVIDGSNFSLDMLAGVRGFYMDNTLSARIDAQGFTKGRTYNSKQGWVDAVGGVRARYQFDEKWFLNMIAFAGGGASKYQWDVYAGAAYAFTANWGGFLGYRAFKVDYQDKDFIYDVLQHGPVVGVQYRW